MKATAAPAAAVLAIPLAPVASTRGPRRRASELRTGELKFVINPDPTPVVKLKIPKKPGPQKSLQEVAAARATENLRRDKKGKVREQVDLFVVAQKAQVVLCYHKKGRQKENL